MKVVMLDGDTLVGHNFDSEERIFKENGIEFRLEKCRTEDEVIEKSRDADGVMTVFCSLNRKVIAALPKCKVFVRYGVGFDVIDVPAATEAGIAVCNLPSYCIEDVAVHTLALILNSLRKVTMYDRSVRRGEWNSGLGYPVHRPDRLTLGFLGFGNIARRAAAYAAPLGFSMIAYDPYLPQAAFDQLKARKVSLDELLASSDIVSVHAPLTEETKHILNRSSIAKMKDGVIIINTSRGALINLSDLAEAVNSGKILAASLDVVEREPLAGDDRKILEHDNVTITPHCSYNSIESAEAMHVEAAMSACAVLKGELPPNTINRKQLRPNGR